MSRTVLILDDDYDLRTTLADVLRVTCRVDCVTVPDVTSLIALGDRALSADLAIIDVNLGLGKPTGIDAYHWLVDHGFSGRIAFLTGHARAHAMIRNTVDSGAALVLQKPASLSALRDLCKGAQA